MTASIEFPSYPDCFLCPLYLSLKPHGLPTRRADLPPTGPKDQALLVIGEAPGYHEWKQRRIWVGKSGRLLHRILETGGIHNFYDVYLSNACRCMTSGGRAPTNGQVNTCKQYLGKDLSILLQHYRRVDILAAGSKAALSLGFDNLRSAFRFQGCILDVFGGRFRCFFTYHPAFILRSRNKAYIRSIAEHINVIRRYVLSGECSSPVEPDVAPPPPDRTPELVSIDIETYGALFGTPQTVFNPVQSERIDGIPRGKQVVLVGLAWEDDSGGEKAASFVLPRHERVFRKWLCRLAENSGTVLFGKHIQFDLSYLRYNDPVAAFLIRPDRFILDDLEILVHLDFELRQERSLKSLVELFGVGHYDRNFELGSVLVQDDPRLLRYNALDCVAPLRLRKILLERIKSTYGCDSAKLSKTCRDLRNDMLWTILHLTETGVAMDVMALTFLHQERIRAAEQIAGKCLELGLTVTGPGSEASRRKFVIDALGDDLIDAPSVELTKKRRSISIGKNNIQFILDSLSPDDPRRLPIELMRQYDTVSHTVTHYTRKLLFSSRNGLLYKPGDRIGFCYPSWHAVPSASSKESEESRGTIQGRITCTNPPKQTEPDEVAACHISRFYPGGKLVSFDEKTLELRVAALLSGDSYLLSVFERDEDPHSALARRMFNTDESDPSWSIYRDIAKRANFRAIYGGRSASGLQTMIRQNIRGAVNVERMFPLDECRRLVSILESTYCGFFEYVKTNIAQVQQKGFLETPTGWGRTFPASPDSAAEHATEIANAPVQTVAALLVLSGQAAIISELSRRNMKSVTPMNLYDAVWIDIYPDEEEQVNELADKYLTRPPLLITLENVLGRTVPLRYTRKVLWPHEEKSDNPAGQPREVAARVSGDSGTV